MVTSNPPNNNLMSRDYQKGNWTVHETMILIEAKKMDEERRMIKRSEPRNKAGAGELRWKWVEDYCWEKGCLRSQNQCNDKWDNLMRNFKRVHDYQNRVLESIGCNDSKSYWEIDKGERKERNLPFGMLQQVYDALVDVVERRSVGSGFKSSSGFGGGGGGNVGVVRVPTPVMMALPPPPLPLPQSEGPLPVDVTEQPQCHQLPLPAVDSDMSEHSDSPAKRRKKGRAREAEGASTSTRNVSGSEISKSAFLIAEVINACDQRQEARHRELSGLHQKRVQIEESKAEITRQGINGLVDAINNLANSILALANSNQNQSSSK